MGPIEAIAWHEITDRGEFHAWRAAQPGRLGFPGPLAEAVADHVDWHEIAGLVEPRLPATARAEHRLVNTEESCGFR